MVLERHTDIQQNIRFLSFRLSFAFRFVIPQESPSLRGFPSGGQTVWVFP
jgi:hypothetical protein